MIFILKKPHSWCHWGGLNLTRFCCCNFAIVTSSKGCTTSFLLGTSRRLWSSLIYSTFSCISDTEIKAFWSHCCSFKLSEPLVAVHSNYSLACSLWHFCCLLIGINLIWLWWFTLVEELAWCTGFGGWQEAQSQLETSLSTDSDNGQKGSFYFYFFGHGYFLLNDPVLLK